MYCRHYGFSEKPFDVTPNPRFLFLTPNHRETLASIEYGVRERRGFITIVGEVGTGKTTLLNAAMDRLDENTRVAFIFNTNVSFDEMLNIALYDWGLTKDNEKLSKIDAIQRLNRFAIDQMAKGGNVVLIVDEAQNLDDSFMESLRLLSNLETHRQKLIQIVLSGQPELNTKLNRHELRQFAQRISIRSYIFPMDEKDTYSYLQHRLKVVQNTGISSFTPEAQKLIWKYSKGVPRKINILCDNALLIGYGLEMKKITGAVVLKAAQDLKWLDPLDEKTPWDVPVSENTGFTWIEAKPPKRALKLSATMAGVGILILAGSIFLNSNELHSAKLFNLISSVKSAALETVHPEEAKEQVQVPRLNIPENEAVIPDTVNQKNSGKNPESETLEKSTGISNLSPSDYHLLKGKSPEFVAQDTVTEATKQVVAFKKDDPSEMQVKEKIASDLTEPVKKEEIIRKIVVKRGDTLFRIITNKLGGYDGMVMARVLQKNPNIVDANKIFAGQEIKLPVYRD